MIIKTIDQAYSGEFKNNHSRFIGHLYPTRTLSEFKECLTQLKKEHPKASHICYAYRLGFENEEVRANDDGEPSGTAGKPILNTLYSYKIQNVSLFVVRYYGGTKLGVPGLIEAYKEASILCLNHAKIFEKEEEVALELNLESEKYFEVIKNLKNNNITITSSSYKEDKYCLKVHVPVSKKKWLDSIYESIN
jgi:uncharacterized YigZ family protein